MSRSPKKQNRRRRFEEFEQRLVMSAQSVVSIASMTDLDAIDVTQSLPGANTAIMAPAEPVTDPAAAAQIADQFGFDGSNQTIAIIDSGIAFTHSAFGGGFGEGFRVVGGFDFAENDANPFDDGPAGFHGTNVAGIAASGDETFRGVASGADLVALRVFDDNGRGDITYVESALQYVLENINTFEHPITTVNLSLGIDADSPEASRAFIIEDELAALEEAGVFISVAAGNNFEDLQTTGLALPAASEFVVPVASSNSLFSDPDANEFFLSDFSQRDSRVLVAPGERITSAVPESLFGGLQENPVLGLSGTSQAAPYVAGASAILREAYAFVGTPDVDQTTIYETFLATADDIFDPITNQTYSRVNLEAALESVVQDQHGDSQVSATDFGQLEGGELLRGTIGKATDVDFFSFQASANGQVELGFEASHDLEPQIEVTDANGNAVDIRIDGGRVFFDVVEGTDYFIGISGAAGNGHYEVTTQFQSSDGSASDLGRTDSVQVTDVVTGESSYSFSAARTGIFALEFETGNQAVVEVLDSSMNRIDRIFTDAGDAGNLQLRVQSGDEIFVRVTTEGQLTINADNLVEIIGREAVVFGTSDADSVTVSDNGQQIDVTLNGTTYSFDRQDIDSVSINGDTDDGDSIAVDLGDGFERTILRQTGVSTSNGSFDLSAEGFANIDVSGTQQLTLIGSTGNDTFVGDGRTLSLGTAIGRGFETLIARGNGGNDQITYTSTDSDDTITASESRTDLRSDGFRFTALDFADVTLNTGGGEDVANLFGSAGADQFVLEFDSAKLTSDSFQLSINDATIARANADDALDSVQLIGSTGIDFLASNDNTLTFRNQSQQRLVARDFLQASVDGNGNNDAVNIVGTDGADRIVASENSHSLQLGDSRVELSSFERLNFNAQFDSQDTLQVTGTSGDDTLVVSGRRARLSFSTTGFVQGTGLSNFDIDLGAGNDSTRITGTARDEQLVADSETLDLTSALLSGTIRDSEDSEFSGNGGDDQVFTHETETLDVVASLGDVAIAVMNQHRLEVSDIDRLEATAIDQAIGEYELDPFDYDIVLRGRWRDASR